MSRLDLSLLDRSILAVAPSWAAQRAAARYKVRAFGQAYEAVNNGRLRRNARDQGNGNATTGQSQSQLRDMARNLDRNHDLSRGILNTLVRNIVGPTGIGVEPQPRGPDGTINQSLANQINDYWQQWSRYPEVTGELNRARYEQLVCRSLFRDGESLWQYIEGNKPKLNHNTAVPFSLELMECDLLPIDFNDPGRNISQGIEIDAWGRPQGYWIYKAHPGEPYGAFPDIKRMPSASIGHIKLTDRLGQRRGVSMFASVLNRLDDLKNYEESERIAAKVAASMAAFIQKGDPSMYPENPGAERDMHFEPGMVFDNLQAGETVGTIDTKRPNPNAALWRDGQLRAVAAGADVSYSSASKNYNGTYSAQRQELVEQWTAYSVCSQAFVDQCTSEVYARFVASLQLGGLIRAPRGWTFAQLTHAQYVPPSMPWIDPVKEVTGWQLQEDRGYISGPDIIRRQGRSPDDVLRSQRKWQDDKAAAGVVTTSPVPPAPEQNTETA